MFITCNTYRQASYSPDVSSGGVVNIFSTLLSGITNRGPVNDASHRTNIWLFQTQFTVTSINNSPISVSNIAQFSVKTTGAQSLVTVGQTTWATAGSSLSTTSSTQPTTAILTVTHRQFGTSSTVANIVVQDFFGRTTYLSTNFSSNETTGFETFTYLGLSTSHTWQFVEIFATDLTTNAVVIGVSASSSVISSTTFTAGGATNVTTTNTLTTAINAALASTSTATTTRTIFSMTTGGTTTTKTAAATTTVTTASIVAATVTTTKTTTVSRPNWWGWSSENGTVVIATGNFLSDDLPAWLEKSAFPSSAIALWKYSTALMTTLWPAPPLVLTSPGVASHSSQVSATTFTLTFATQTTTTIFGTSSYTTTTSATAVPAFTRNSSVGATITFPISTVAQTVTSYSTFSSTWTLAISNPANTTTFASLPDSTGGTTGGVTTIVTQLLTTSGFGSSRGSFISNVTLTTVTDGYTTASIGYAGASNETLYKTTVITGNALSFTTTTSNQTLPRSPGFGNTAVVSTGSTIASSVTTGQSVGTIAGSSTTSTTIASNFSALISVAGSSEGWTKALWTSPYVPSSSILSLSSPGQTCFAPGNVQWWVACPTMQGFVNATQSSVTYQNLSIPSLLSNLWILPLKSGQVLAYDTILGASITSTAWGDWILAGNPATVTFSGGTSIAGFTSSTSASASSGTSAASTNSIVVSFPANMDPAGMSIYQTTSSTFTTSTAGTTTTSSASGTSSNGSGIAFLNSITSTFVESYAFTQTRSFTQTISDLGNMTIINGILTNTTAFISTMTVLSTSTWSTLSIPSATSNSPTIQFTPGVGGIPKYSANSAGATIYANAAAISLIGSSASTTWSSADPNFFQVVIGAAFTTSSSSSSGPEGTYPHYTIPGQASIISSPAMLVTTGNNPFVDANTQATSFWRVPDPVLNPLFMKR